MTNAATWMPEKRTQTPSPSPDLIPAKNHQPETYIGIGTSDGGTSHIPVLGDWVFPPSQVRGIVSRNEPELAAPVKTARCKRRR
jgi:hypothetical protein